MFIWLSDDRLELKSWMSCEGNVQDLWQRHIYVCDLLLTLGKESTAFRLH